MASTPPSQSKAKASLWRAPYLWLTAAALAELVLASLLLFSFITYLYDEIKYLSSPKTGISPAFNRPTFSEWLERGWSFVVTPIFCVGGAICLLHYRRKIGLYLSAAGSATWLIWFGYVVLAPLAENLVRGWTYPHTDQFSSALALPLLVYVIAFPLLLLSIGWRKVKWN